MHFQMQAVAGKLVVPPSKQYLKGEIENIIAACNDISEQLAFEDECLHKHRPPRFHRATPEAEQFVLSSAQCAQ